MANLQLDERGVVAPCPTCGQKNRMAFQRLGEAVRCARCKTEIPAPSEPIEAPTGALFDAMINLSALPVLVDYWAPWCGPCRMVAPELAKVAARNAGRLLVAKVNTDALPDVAARFSIQSIPTMAVFAGGREAGRFVGVRPAADIEALAARAGKG
jgi:thioredoxin 2